MQELLQASSPHILAFAANPRPLRSSSECVRAPLRRPARLWLFSSRYHRPLPHSPSTHSRQTGRSFFTSLTVPSSFSGSHCLVRSIECREAAPAAAPPLLTACPAGFLYLSPSHCSTRQHNTTTTYTTAPALAPASSLHARSLHIRTHLVRLIDAAPLSWLLCTPIAGLARRPHTSTQQDYSIPRLTCFALPRRRSHSAPCFDRREHHSQHQHTQWIPTNRTPPRAQAAAVCTLHTGGARPR